MTDTARSEKALQGIIEALIKTGIKKQDIIAALDRIRASYNDGADFSLLR